MRSRISLERSSALRSPRAWALCTLIVFSLAFAPATHAQTQSSSPTMQPSDPLATQLLQMQLQLIGRLSERSQQIANLNKSLRGVSAQLKTVSENYSQASTTVVNLKLDLQATSSSQKKWQQDFESLQAAAAKKAADDAKALATARHQRDVAVVKASHWWLWLVAGIIGGVAADEGAHKVGLLR